MSIRIVVADDDPFIRRLVTRFADNEAEFLFVPKNQVDRVVKETGAIPFDAPGVELGHRDGKGCRRAQGDHFPLLPRSDAPCFAKQ